MGIICFYIVIIALIADKVKSKKEEREWHEKHTEWREKMRKRDEELRRKEQEEKERRLLRGGGKQLELILEIEEDKENE